MKDDARLGYDREYLAQDKQIRIERMGESIAPLKEIDPANHGMLEAMMKLRIDGQKFLEAKLAANGKNLSEMTPEELVESLRTEVMAGFATAGWTDFASDGERRRIENAPSESFTWNMMPLLDYVYLDQAVKERNVVNNLRGCRKVWESLNSNPGYGSTLEGEADKEVAMTEKMHEMIAELVEKKAATS